MGGRDLILRMLSARGTRTIRLQRRKSGLDFSIKGGKEHGIGVVVSWIKEGGAAKELRLGDEILAVNGQSLFGLSHSEVVSKLRGAGHTVHLLVRPNQTLEDIFTTHTTTSSSNYIPQRPQLERVLSPVTPVAEKQPQFTYPLSETGPPLPQGWGQKIDQKTGRLYFENHYTCTSTWTDPRSRKPVPLTKFQWNNLPPGWERFLDTEGDIYYVNHHTQTTHWDCPTSSRQRQLLQQLKGFLTTKKQELKKEEESLAKKRKLLLEKNAQLDLLAASSSQSHDLREVELEEGESQTDLLDDIMLLNEEVDGEDEQLSVKRTRLHFLTGILQSGVRAEESHQEAASCAVSLASELSKLHTLVKNLSGQVESISKVQRSKDPNATPLHHILQLPALVEEKALVERQQWVHVCQDKLTPKTTCELRLELALAQEAVSYGRSLEQRLTELYTHAAAQTHRGWEELVQQLASLDFQLLQVPHANTSSFREKLEKWVTF